MNSVLVQSLQIQLFTLVRTKPSESIVKERVLIPYSFKSMLKESGLLGDRMIDMFHFTDFDH